VPAQPFDVIFADPPYAGGSGTAVVAAVREAGWLAPGGWLAIETEARDAVDAGGWQIEAERRVGRARLTLIRG
jgi:16S rRNA (guanine966-N2)-methyltransferase